MAYQPIPPLGQAAMAASLPVVIASNQSTLPVSAATLPLPSGAATSAKQDTIIGHVDGIETLVTSTNTKLDTVNTNLTTIDGRVDGLETSNSAIQTSVQLIDDAIVTDDEAFTPATTKVMMSGYEYDDTATDSVNEGDAGAARMSANRNQYIQIRDGAGNERGVNVTAANALTVDGSGVTQPVSNAGLTELAAAINASSQLDVNIAASGATVPVSNAGLTSLNGAIAGTEVQVDVVAALPAGNNNIGDVDIASIAAGDNNIGNVDVVTLPSIPAGTNNIGDVDVLTVNGVAPAFGSGVRGATVQRVTIATDDVVPASQSGTWNINNVSGTVSLPTGAATLAEQQTQTASLSVLDDWDESDRAKVNPIVGQAGVAAGAGATGATVQRVVLATDTTVPNVTGNVAHDAADSGAPIKTGGRARSSEITPVANDDRVDSIHDLSGKQIVLPYANPENFVSGAITSAMTGTTSTSLIAAPGAGLRNYITTIIVSNAHATVGTDVVIQDGSGGTTLMTIPAASVYGGAVITLPTPLRQPTTNTAIFCANVTTGASTKVSAVGYKGA